MQQLLEVLGRKAEKQFLPMQPGDVAATWADVDDLVTDFGYKPTVSVQEGVKNFVERYLKKDKWDVVSFLTYPA